MSAPAKQPQLLGSLLAPGNRRNDTGRQLGELCRHAEFLVELEKKLLSRLPENLQAHCRIANYANDTLVLHTDSAAWASKLRYATSIILDIMRQQCGFETLKTVRIRVKPESGPGPETAPVTTDASATAGLIRQVANTITDQDLRNSLLKIARHYRVT